VAFNVKAFNVFGEQSQAVESADRDIDVEEPAEEVEYQETYSILENDSGLEYQLPQRQRCACHLLTCQSLFLCLEK
jgi:hypothetical protein